MSLNEYAMETNCDAEGDFEFKGVANGGYYLTSTVVWQISDNLQATEK